MKNGAILRILAMTCSVGMTTCSSAQVEEVAEPCQTDNLLGLWIQESDFQGQGIWDMQKHGGPVVMLVSENEVTAYLNERYWYNAPIAWRDAHKKMTTFLLGSRESEVVQMRLADERMFVQMKTDELQMQPVASLVRFQHLALEQHLSNIPQNPVVCMKLSGCLDLFVETTPDEPLREELKTIAGQLKKPERQAAECMALFELTHRRMKKAGLTVKPGCELPPNEPRFSLDDGVRARLAPYPTRTVLMLDWRDYKQGEVFTAGTVRQVQLPVQLVSKDMLTPGDLHRIQWKKFIIPGTGQAPLCWFHFFEQKPAFMNESIR